MIPLEEAQLKLKDLKQALHLEKQHRFVDVQGKKKRFSQFVLDVIRLLGPLMGDTEHTQKLVSQFKQYQFASLPERMSTIQQLEKQLAGLNLEALLRSPAPAAAPKKRGGQPDVALGGTGTRGLSPDVTREGHPERLDMAVQFVKGVGPRMAELLKKLDVQTVRELLYTFPRKYLDYNMQVPIAQLQQNSQATVVGVVRTSNIALPSNRAIAILSVVIEDQAGARMLAKWIFAKSNRRMLEGMKTRYGKGAMVMMSGTVKWDAYKKMMAMDRPETEVLSFADETEGQQVAGVAHPTASHVGRILPVYSLVEGLNLRALRRVIQTVLEAYLPLVDDPLPLAIQSQFGLVGLHDALGHIHFPETTAQYEQARHRLVFDELFAVQLRLIYIRSKFKQSAQLSLQLPYRTDGYAQRLIDALPFTLTGAQQRALDDIKQDMASPEPMYRLLQGDVGSGKTIVALLTLLIGVDNGFQGCLMAPTEILAEQHYRNFQQWLVPLGLRAALLLGRQGVRERREVIQGLLNGQTHVVVGTHALMSDDVEFDRLGVIVIDEQHRFGVRQRLNLKNKAERPEMLSMTATPIPRTLALSLHGDMDVSVIDELPPGRTPIVTSVLRGKKGRRQVEQLVRAQIASGRQVYYVFPLIEDSESLSAKAATQEFELLDKEIFPEFRVGLLHGKLGNDEKDAVMQQFKSGQLQILVSTTVVEVGVDVPNATVMIIENAERFGLSQLHQLRGRVGRGGHQSYCVLLSDSATQETLDRLSIMERSTNGFEIAEQDLAIRGPGDFLGTRQSGLPEFLLADLVTDYDILAEARQAAQAIVADEDWRQTYPELSGLMTHSAFQTPLDFMTAG
ncbi:MAG: ATP-dependent DNA helicase RecG [Cyanobacteria bacterium HKST-UBA04]|nr:ATP-dependent DNA helicase RecG [Cyanobacteria bacterium HKST-UBA04]MCA9841003.1 ATP-dependent DNA helicase RecG [Cyanobacteria bacterium HKST-UBA03]